MNRTELEGVINVAWENRDEINSSTQGEIRKAVEQTLSAMDSGDCALPKRPMANGLSISGPKRRFCCRSVSMT
jgi:2,3,4,5-tetrahydropyridine-2-carboxylate N-succinyltransferase